MNNIYPLPGAVLPATWNISAGKGATDIRSRNMHIPTDISPLSRVIRDHEMAHVKYSPQNVPLGQGTAILAAEDCRIAILAWQRHSIDTVGAEFLEMPTVQNPYEAALYALALGLDNTACLEKRNKLLESLTPKQRGIFQRARNIILDAPETIHSSIAAAHLLQELKEENNTDSEDEAEGEGKENSEGNPDAGDFEEEDEDEEEEKDLPPSLEKLFAKAVEQTAKEKVKEAQFQLRSSDPIKSKAAAAQLMDSITNPNWRWGEMTIQHPSRTTPKHARKKAKRRAEPMGVRLARPERWLLDRAIFATNPTKRGSGALLGSLLIDISGSMHINPEDLEEIARLAPNAIVATYGGTDRAKAGALAIIANGGTMAYELEPIGADGSNVVDGPALRWLARQKAPRYWISDGAVTGVVDDSAPGYAREALWVFVEDNQITRYNDINDFMRGLGLWQH